jgi:hypothetical protein
MSDIVNELRESARNVGTGLTFGEVEAEQMEGAASLIEALEHEIESIRAKLETAESKLNHITEFAKAQPLQLGNTSPAQFYTDRGRYRLAANILDIIAGKYEGQ